MSLPNIPQNSSRTAASLVTVLLFHIAQHNRVHNFEEAPLSFTMAPCVVVEILEGKQRCSKAPIGEHAGGRARDCAMWLVHEKRKVSEEQPIPAAAHHTITTVRRPDNTHSSALVRSQSIQSMADSSCRRGGHPSEPRLHFCHFRAFFLAVAISVTFSSLRTLANEAERTLDLPRRRSRHGTSPWLSTE